MAISETSTQPTPEDDRPETVVDDKTDETTAEAGGPVTGKTHPGVITDDLPPRHDLHPDAIADNNLDPTRPQ